MTSVLPSTVAPVAAGPCPGILMFTVLPEKPRATVLSSVPLNGLEAGTS